MKNQENDHLHASLPEALFDLHLWDQLSPHACEEIARIVEKHLPASFRFLHVETFAAGTQQHHMALFEWMPSTNHPPCSFALIPGGAATLGYDRTQRLVPRKDLVQEWQDCHLYEIASITGDVQMLRDCFPDLGVYTHTYDALYAHMDKVLSPLRTVTISPFLLQISARPAEQFFVSYRRYHQQRSMKGRTRVRWFTQSWPPPAPHQGIVDLLEREGFRLPTSDEWEYACAAQSRTLFYWGNGPFEILSKEHYHTGVNAFGLSIVQNPYQWEFCAEPGIMRGGDGGGAACGCEGQLADALTLASAYMIRVPEEWLITGVYGAHIRRLYDLIPPSPQQKEKI